MLHMTAVLHCRVWWILSLTHSHTSCHSLHAAMYLRICQARAESTIRTTQQLVQAIGNTYVGHRQKSSRSKTSTRIHPATRTFQVKEC